MGGSQGTGVNGGGAEGNKEKRVSDSDFGLFETADVWK